MDAFDSEVLIYAAVPGHSKGERVLALFPTEQPEPMAPRFGLGSVLLVPELLAKPLRTDANPELAALMRLLNRLDLRPTDLATADLAAGLAARHRLKAADAVHLATAVQGRADRFITNNSKDFPKSISEIDITYPADLPKIEPGS